MDLLVTLSFIVAVVAGADRLLLAMERHGLVRWRLSAPRPAELREHGARLDHLLR
ncbi:hypothetical protein [Herbidospora cretacea]|uniref:hypothetical protein n=1 Tax=Herbidospora cretacea TaxID=28444 RepID=UPI000B2831D3|nr:hypothetical protein [Herbidospora cretacea]